MSDIDVCFVSTEQIEQPANHQMDNEQMGNGEHDLQPGMSDNEVDSSGKPFLIPS